MNLSSSKEGSSSFKCTTTLYGENEETLKNVRRIRILLQLRIMLADYCSDVGHFLDLDQRRNGTEFILANQMEKWDKIVERMTHNFAESGHHIFRVTSALERGELRSRGEGKKSIHFNGSAIELTLRTIFQ